MIAELFVLHEISKTDVARITKLDTETFQDESWDTIYFPGQKFKGQGYQFKMFQVIKTLLVWVFALL